jgi:hypothetical protein
MSVRERGLVVDDDHAIELAQGYHCGRPAAASNCSASVRAA